MNKTNPSTTNKTKMITLRCPNELASRLSAAAGEGKKKTQWLIEAIEAKLILQMRESIPEKTIESTKVIPSSKVKYKEYHTPNGVFSSQTEAANANGIARRTISDRVRSKNPEYYAVTYDGTIVGK